MTRGQRKRSSLTPLLAIACALMAGVAQAQPPVPVPGQTIPAPVAAEGEIVIGPWMPRSGDAWIDLQLADINAYGSRYRGAFIDEVVRYHAAPRALVESLLDVEDWLPGDVYAACALASIAGRPCRSAVTLRAASSGDGWGTIALALGLDDQRAAIARFKDTITASQRHWARPPAARVVEPKAAAPVKAGKR